MYDRISIDPKVCHGQACIKGTRIPVHQIVGMLANGDTIESLLKAYPSIEREDILACLEYAAMLAEEQVISSRGSASMTRDLDTIEQRIQRAVEGVDERWEQLDDSDAAWTRALKDAIGTVGEQSGYLVCAAGCKYSDNGEWLYDMTWLKVEGDMVLDIALALESEWNPDRELLFDFQKLLVSRARHRVMLFWQGTDAAAESQIEQFLGQVHRFHGSASGDRYLFGYYIGDDRPMQFRLHVVE